MPGLICRICRLPPQRIRMDEALPIVGDRCERTITDDVPCSGRYISVPDDKDREAKGQIVMAGL